MHFGAAKARASMLTGRKSGMAARMVERRLFSSLSAPPGQAA
jgi:hypothetical protein